MIRLVLDPNGPSTIEVETAKDAIEILMGLLAFGAGVSVKETAAPSAIGPRAVPSPAQLQHRRTRSQMRLAAVDLQKKVEEYISLHQPIHSVDILDAMRRQGYQIETRTYHAINKLRKDKRILQDSRSGCYSVALVAAVLEKHA